MFRQAFLLCQCSFIVNNILSVQTHNIRNILLTTLFLFWRRTLVPLKFQKMENNSTLEKALLVCNWNAELLRLVGATFDFKVASLRRTRKKILIILRSLQKKVRHFLFYLFVVVDKYQLKGSGKL